MSLRIIALLHSLKITRDIETSKMFKKSDVSEEMHQHSSADAIFFNILLSNAATFNMS